jgi:putative lipoic acid-binding regulatory protein
MEEAQEIPSMEGEELKFPVQFDLRIIYVFDDGATIVEDLEAIYKSLNVSCAMIQGVHKPGARYGRMGSRLTFASREQLYATYEAIGKLPYVKTAI